jgi:hypothetical protein
MRFATNSGVRNTNVHTPVPPNALPNIISGKIDATLEVKSTNASWNANKPLPSTKIGIQNNANRPNYPVTTPNNCPTLTVPLEIKTGSDFDSKGHKAQVRNWFFYLFF